MGKKEFIITEQSMTHQENHNTGRKYILNIGEHKETKEKKTGLKLNSSSSSKRVAQLHRRLQDWSLRTDGNESTTYHSVLPVVLA